MKKLTDVAILVIETCTTKKEKETQIFHGTLESIRSIRKYLNFENNVILRR